MDSLNEKELLKTLRMAPDLRMSQESKNQIVRNLQLSNPKGQAPQRLLSFFRTFGLVSFGIIFACILGFLVVHRENITTFNGKTTDVSNDANTNSTYFGVKLPFQPKLPMQTLSGYKLTSSNIEMTFQSNKTHFEQYYAAFSKSKNPTSGNADSSPIRIYEVVGDSIDANNGGAINTKIIWDKTFTANNQTYYYSHMLGTTVGFVKDHVVYVFRAPSLTEYTLLQYAEGNFQAAPIQWVTRSSKDNKDAMSNVSFHPVTLPGSLASQWKLASASSDIQKATSGATSQTITLSYQKVTDHNKSFMVIETPLNNAVNQYANMVGYVPTWKDQKRGLEFHVMGTTSVPELNQIASLFKTNLK